MTDDAILIAIIAAALFAGPLLVAVAILRPPRVEPEADPAPDEPIDARYRRNME